MSRHLSRQAVTLILPILLGVSFLLLDSRGSPSAVYAGPAGFDLPPSGPASPTAATTRVPTLLHDLDLAGDHSDYREAGEALRRGDCRAALAILDARAAPGATDAAFARVVRGLHAEACGELELARDLLFLGGGRGSVLEDWRLLALGRVVFELGDEPVALGALSTLLARYPESPLWPEALMEAARQAHEAQRLPRLYALARHGRPGGGGTGASPPVPVDVATEIDTLVWQAAGEAGDEVKRRWAGRRLLVDHPAKAEDLDVADVFRSSDGSLDWGRLLTTEELSRRARSLVAERRYGEAREALEAVAPEERVFDWHLQMSDLLVRERRGAEALATLDGLSSTDSHQAAHLAWHRALAKRDLGAVRRGRTNRPAAERRTLRREARDHLRRVAILDADPDLTRAALRRLFTDLVDEDLPDPALEVLGRLRHRDADDATGALWLWRQGWEAFQRRQHSTAIGWWAELEGLYPEHRLARSGRYWTGRAFEALGQAHRAREIYRRVADADTTDFYRRYALAHLQGEPLSIAKVPGQEPEPWPRDPRLARARLLTEVGLDGAALTELQAVLRTARRNPIRAGEAVGEPGAGPLERAGHALESEILARQGEIRASIGPIRRAFPALGGPSQVAVPERALRLYYPVAYQVAVGAQAERFDVPLHVLYGMIRQESGFDPTARSRAGARGLLQLMPATGREVARRIGLRYSYRRLSDPSFNVAVGAAYFRQMLNMFDDQLELALAGYNGGPYRIKRLWRRAGQSDLPHFLEALTVTESRIYVKRILVLSDSYRQLYDLDDHARVAWADRGVEPLQGAR